MKNALTTETASLKVDYALAKNGVNTKQVYSLDHTTSSEQLSYDKCIVNHVLRACILGQTTTFSHCLRQHSIDITC